MQNHGQSASNQMISQAGKHPTAKRVKQQELSISIEQNDGCHLRVKYQSRIEQMLEILHNNCINNKLIMYLLGGGENTINTNTQQEEIQYNKNCR